MMNILLLLISICIYMTFGLKSICFILTSSLLTYLCSLKMNNKNKKVLLSICITFNVLLLIFFKIYNYNEFFGLLSTYNIIVPLGISYYTFQLISYIIDVYKRKYEPEKSIFKFLLYIMYFPYLLMGPINKYDEISKTLFNKNKFNKENLLDGILRILIGLFKKLLIASRISVLVSYIVTNSLNGAYVIYTIILYSIELYADFSGGIDIVLGISNIFGIKLVENFKQPYFSQSIKEFWRRWHISLSNWFKDYIYIPLGGNKVGMIRSKINILIIFILSGLWHGINYFYWGFFHGLLMIIIPNKITKNKFINICITFILVSLLWIFFIWTNPSEAFIKLGSIFSNFNVIDLFSNLLNMNLNINELIVLAISIILLIIYDFIEIKHNVYNIKNFYKFIIICVMIIIILLFGYYGIGFNVTEFIYSNF